MEERGGEVSRDCRKVVAADSSSVILLQKAGLLKLFLAHYQVIIAESVYRELTAGHKQGTEQLEALLAGNVVAVNHTIGDAGMGAGERDTLGLYLQGEGEFVLVDDKKAARYCKRMTIPFINSLLVPRLLYYSGNLSQAVCRGAMLFLFDRGYYSEKVKVKAEGLSREKLAQFLPSTSLASQQSL